METQNKAKEKTKTDFEKKIISLVKENPNDYRLGNKIREYINTNFLFKK